MGLTHFGVQWLQRSIRGDLERRPAGLLDGGIGSDHGQGVEELIIRSKNRSDDTAGHRRVEYGHVLTVTTRCVDLCEQGREI